MELIAAFFDESKEPKDVKKIIQIKLNIAMKDDITKTKPLKNLAIKFPFTDFAFFIDYSPFPFYIPVPRLPSNSVVQPD